MDPEDMIPKLLLPGQVGERFDRGNFAAVQTRHIILDYVSPQYEDKKSKQNKVKWYKRLLCCKTKVDGSEKYKVEEDEDDSKIYEFIEDVEVKIEEDRSKSLPRRLWGRLKKRVGF